VIVAGSEGGDVTDVVATATAGLARYKQPRACLTIERLPRSLQGKVQRARMRELVLARYEMADGPYPKFAVRKA
jgi:acyl-coenzyme A synthetase/AMP-(fatty) acid ligase